MDTVFLIIWILAGIISITKIYQLYIKYSPSQRQLAQIIVPLIHQPQEVETFCGSIPKEPITPVTKAALTSGDNPLDQIDQVLLNHQKSLEKGVGLLAVFGNLSTFMGLVGSIGGCIQAVAHEQNPELYKSGIEMALNSVIQGLAIGVPCLVLYAVLQNRKNILTEDLNKGALDIFIALKEGS